MEFYVVEAMLGALLFGFGGILFKWNAHNRGDDAYFFVSLCKFLLVIELPNL